MKKTTIPFMLVLLASAHLAQAAGKPFTATITTSVKGSTKPNFVIPQLFIQQATSDGNLPKTTLGNGSTQVQLLPGHEYVLMGNTAHQKDQPWPLPVGKHVFRADSSKPNIKLDGQTYSDNTLRLTVTIN
jgi:hypothetical protein